jgi:predicted nucleic acid-binding protein
MGRRSGRHATEQMIVVDTSVWIDYFNGTNNTQTERLDVALGSEIVAIGDLIALEILQGFKNNKDYQQAKESIEQLTCYDMLGQQSVIACADNYRALRKKGFTIRKTADVIIATFCIENKIPLLFSDKDFLPFVEHLNLRTAI